MAPSQPGRNPRGATRHQPTAVCNSTELSGAPDRPRDRSAIPGAAGCRPAGRRETAARAPDRKSTRLNSSHGYISYAVFCLKKKKKTEHVTNTEKRSSE